MLGSRSLAWSVPLVFTLWSGAARAGCPNPCELTVEPAELSPALDCVSLETRPEGCECELFLSLHNNCDVPVDAVTFEFESCRDPVLNEIERPCSTVEPQHEGTFTESYHELGAQRTQLTVSVDGDQHTLALEANVTEFNDTGCGCSVPGSDGSAGPALAGLLLLGLRRRRASRASEA